MESLWRGNWTESSAFVMVCIKIDKEKVAFAVRTSKSNYINGYKSTLEYFLDKLKIEINSTHLYSDPSAKYAP